MKARIIISVLALLLLNSCIVKSLFPFFTKDTIHFEKSLLGNWADSKNNEWKISSLKEKIKEENKDDKQAIADDLGIFKDYAEGYYIENNKSHYLAVPFKINNQLFIDFLPFSPENEFEEIPTLVSYHYVTAHSLVKVDVTNNKLSLKWLDSDKLEKLLDEKKIKIEYTQTLDFPSYLLTASSEELQKFIKKYMASDDTDKWSTDVELDLHKIDAKH